MTIRPLLITGASRGIGAATARLAARDGWDVALNYSRDEAGAQAVAEAVRSLGRHALIVRADVSREDEVMAMFETVERRFGALAGFVNNAGIVDRPMPLAEMSAERLQRIFAVNVFGAYLCAREAVRRMGGGGAIVNVSSVAARLGSPGEYVDYAGSKAALDTLTIGLAKEVAAQGIRVNAVRPGIIDTSIHASGGQPDRAQRLAPLIPLQRAGTADEIAQAIVWLLSDAASYTTGAVLDVTGGR